MTTWKRVEREFANRLQEATGVECWRVGHEESRAGNIGDTTTELPICSQVRSGYNPSIKKALEDAQEAAEDGELAVAAVYRRRGQGRRAERMAVLSWADFFRLMERAFGDD